MQLNITNTGTFLFLQFTLMLHHLLLRPTCEMVLKKFLFGLQFVHRIKGPVVKKYELSVTNSSIVMKFFGLIFRIGAKRAKKNPGSNWTPN